MWHLFLDLTKVKKSKENKENRLKGTEIGWSAQSGRGYCSVHRNQMTKYTSLGGGKGNERRARIRSTEAKDIKLFW